VSVVLGVALALVAVVAFVSLAGGASGGEGQFQPNAERIGTLGKGVRQDANLRGRMTMLEASLRETLADPLGPGVGYTASKYGYDEASTYAGLLLGTGFMGTFAFLAIVVLLARRYVWAMRRGHKGHDLGVLGLATLACGLVAGVSSESVLLGPVQSIVWWSILGACYFGIRTSDGGMRRGR
jgi:O-antigen ligase